MATDSNIRYFMSFIRDGKVIETHILDFKEQLKVLTAVARNKGCDTEVYSIKLSDEMSTPGHCIEINNVTTDEEKNIAEDKKIVWLKCVKCLETGEIFPSIKEASRKHGITYRSLYNAIKSGIERKGFHFVLFRGEVPDSVKNQMDMTYKGKSGGRSRKILCVTTGQIFNSVSELFAAYQHISISVFYRNMKSGKPTKGLQFQYI